MSMGVFYIDSGPQTGTFNMALDEVLLDYVRQQTFEKLGPLFIVRTYAWTEPTVSLGLHQPQKDYPTLWQHYHTHPPQPKAWVKRPTGGRAILHGKDSAFSFITNAPELLRPPLKESYCILTRFIKTALQALEIPLQTSCEPSEKAYTRSANCFETQTPSDLVSPDGKKRVGSSQLRRSGGLLQHGSAFLDDYPVTHNDFSSALFSAVAHHYGQPTLEPFPDLSVLKVPLEQAVSRYDKVSTEIVASLSITSGSHLIPASDSN